MHRHLERQLVDLLHVLRIDRPERGGADQRRLRVDDPVNREHHMVGREVLAVVEGDARAQLDRPERRIAVRG